MRNLTQFAKAAIMLFFMLLMWNSSFAQINKKHVENAPKEEPVLMPHINPNDSSLLNS